jgi:methylated-DNA-[protein]-cysteine S-methyltransferase
MMSHLVFQTEWGWMTVAASDRGISAILLPVKSQLAAEAAARKMRREAGFHKVLAPHPAVNVLLEDARNQLGDFLHGHRRSVEFPVDLSSGSSFQRRVWRTILRIPYGRVRSYQWVAERIGGRRYARAVGLALGANPVPIIVPCHRVVASHGGLGGFSAGLRNKRRLLALEGSLAQLTR